LQVRLIVVPDRPAPSPLDYAPPPPRQRTRPIVWIAAALVLAGLTGSMFPAKCGRGMPPSRKAVAQSDVAAMEAALDAFEVDVGRLPTSTEGLAALVQRPTSVERWAGPYLPPRRLLTDPWGNPYRYDPWLSDDQGRVWSLGPDGKPDTADDIPVKVIPIR
jgi:general secretion pathway protein G